MKEKKNQGGAASGDKRNPAAPRGKAKASKAKLPPGKPIADGPSRSTTSRQYRILEIIQQNPGLTALEICERVGCSESSFYRDLRYLTLDRGFPIQACEHKRNGYTLAEPVLGFASMYITSSELLSLLLARRSVERTHHAAFTRGMDGAMSKLSVLMTEEISRQWGEVDALVSFRSSAVEVLIDTDVAITVWDALLASEEIELMYWKLETPGPAPRRLRPLHLLCMDYAWYLFADDPDGTDTVPHKYMLGRMSEVRRTGRKFTREEEFDVDEILAHSIGVYGGNEPQHLHLRLDSRAARWFGERRFHDTQQFTMHPDGTAELTMQVAINPELERLVMGWGSQVEVLSPQSLRERIREEGLAVAGRLPE